MLSQPRITAKERPLHHAILCISTMVRTRAVILEYGVLKSRADSDVNYWRTAN